MAAIGVLAKTSANGIKKWTGIRIGGSDTTVAVQCLDANENEIANAGTTITFSNASALWWDKIATALGANTPNPQDVAGIKFYVTGGTGLYVGTGGLTGVAAASGRSKLLVDDSGVLWAVDPRC